MGVGKGQGRRPTGEDIEVQAGMRGQAATVEGVTGRGLGRFPDDARIREDAAGSEEGRVVPHAQVAEAEPNEGRHKGSTPFLHARGPCPPSRRGGHGNGGLPLHHMPHHNDTVSPLGLHTQNTVDLNCVN